LLAPHDRTCTRRIGVRHTLSSRVQATLTVLVLVLSSMAGVLHDATTTHVRCAQHGELVDRRTDLAELGVPTVHAIQSEIHALPAAPAAGSEGHEHCALASAIRESRLAPYPPALVAAPVTVSEIALAARPSEVARARGLYHTAPKTSPPA